MVSTDDYALVVKAGEAPQLSLEEGLIDDGDNSVVTSGKCEGFFVDSIKACRLFGKKVPNNHEKLDVSDGVNGI